MDLEVVSGPWSRDELERAHSHYAEVAAVSAETGDWGPWANLFTEDAHYVEHHYGDFYGRDQIYQWISTTMAEWPNRAMTQFPHDWCVCDEERGWWICKIQNRFSDPGDGKVYQAHNVTVLHYAGNMQFSYEEDAYNPANFAPMVLSWLEALKAHEGTDADPSVS